MNVRARINLHAYETRVERARKLLIEMAGYSVAGPGYADEMLRLMDDTKRLANDVEMLVGVIKAERGEG